MTRRPKVGTRVKVTSGQYAGRQGRTTSSAGHQPGWVGVDLLGGVSLLGVSVPLTWIVVDNERKIHKLPARKLQVGDRLVSLTGLTIPLGNFITIRGVHWPELSVESDYGTLHTMRPTRGFEKRWALLDGYPIEWPMPSNSTEGEGR